MVCYRDDDPFGGELLLTSLGTLVSAHDEGRVATYGKTSELKKSNRSAKRVNDRVHSTMRMYAGLEQAGISIVPKTRKY
jgi:hypothetical protein